MPFRALSSLLQPLTRRVEAVEQSLSRPANAITFLVVRFVLMIAMVLGFSWFAFHSMP
jgi:predicted Na+-dependent transporter